MRRSLCGLLTLPAFLVTALAGQGCDSGSNETGPGPTPANAAAPSVNPAATPPAGSVSAIETSGGTPTIKAVMGALTKGPNSLTTVIGKELEADPIPWETVQSQTKEYARLAAELGKNGPPKGEKNSWDALTLAWSETANALDKASQAKDADAALDAHGKLAGSCMACHRAHRVMGPGGFGGPGGPGGRGPGGPPSSGAPSSQ
jgi:hypothetical protein